MGRGIRKFKPGIGHRAHVLLAASLWTSIGMFLLFRGVFLALDSFCFWPVWAGLVVGTIKSTFILDRVARSGIDRILHFADNTCIGAVYSWKTWMLVLGMMILSIFLRRLNVFPEPRSMLCVAIGWALIFSSRHAWKIWLNWKAEPE